MEQVETLPHSSLGAQVWRQGPEAVLSPHSISVN